MTIGWHEIELPQIDFNPITNLRPANGIQIYIEIQIKVQGFNFRLSMGWRT